jgi:hypothetical protein
LRVTTPDTSAVRAWARSNGFDVAARGRLPAEVVDAYTASRTSGGAGAEPTEKPTRKPTAKRPAAKQATEKASTTRTPAKKVPARKAPAGKPTVKKAPSKRAPSTRQTRSVRAQAEAPPAPPAPTPTPAPADPTEAFADASLEAITTDPPTPHAAPASDGALQRLVEQVHALTTRVEALEARAVAQPDKPAKSLFRRQR